MKHLLLVLAVLLAAPMAHAQKAKRLRGKALIDSLEAVSKANSKKYLDLLQQEQVDNAAAKKKLDDKNGFRSYHFGDLISSYSSFAKAEGEGEGDTKYYTNPTENLLIGDANISQIVYGFYKDKLYSIRIEMKGLIDSRKVKDAFTAQYGSGFQSNKYIESYSWFGNAVWLSYKENSITHDGSISILSKPIAAEKAADSRQAAKKAGSDL